MSSILQFVILGLGVGGIYALAALGVVLIYRGSGVVNFAQGAVGMVGAYTFFELHQSQSLSFFAAFVPALLLCGAIGLLIQVLVMYPLRVRSPLLRLLATLGVLAVLQGFTALKYSTQTLLLDSSLPISRVTIFGASVGADRVWILVIVTALTAVLAAIYKFTRFGLATTAGAENPRALVHLGYSAPRIAGVNWVIGSMLAGVAGILLVPITGLQVTALTLLVVPALAAAVVGNMTSFPLTFAAGLAIGVAQSLSARYVHVTGFSAAVPFFIIMVALMARGSTLPGRGEANLRLPSVGSGRVRPLVVVPALAVLVVLVFTIPVAWVDGLTTTMIAAVLLLSVVVVTGYAGQLSLAQIALSGIGALVASRLVAEQGFSFLVALLVGVLVAVPIGVVVGLPALRARGANLAIATLGLSVAVEAMIFNSSSLGGSDAGINVGFPTVFGLDVNTILFPRRYALVVIAFFVLCALVVTNLRRGKSGRRLLATRANERAAAALGVDVLGAKLYAFGLSAMIASLAGILLAFRQPAVVMSTSFHSFDAVGAVGNAVIGGIGYVLGPIIGGVLQIGGIGTNIGNLFGSDVQKYLVPVSGLLFILTLITAPDGLVEYYGRGIARMVTRARDRRVRRAKRPAVVLARGAMEASRGPAGRIKSRTLRTENLSVSFGGTAALVDFSVEVSPGEVLGLIGPNGAGKSTCIDAMTGFVKPARGAVFLGDRDITQLSPRRRAASGLARSFQSLELFEDITVLENLLVASEARSLSSYFTDLVYPGRATLNDAARDAIETLKLEPYLEQLPKELPYGVRRLVAIARTLAMEPSVLLLDEPASGLSGTERDELSVLIRDLAQIRGMAVLLVEHDVELVMSTCDRVVALDFGSEIARGIPDEVRANQAVRAAYLGEPDSVGTVEVPAGTDE